MFTNNNIVDLYKDFLRLANQVINTPHRYKEIMFDKQGNLKASARTPMCLTALEAMLKVLKEQERREIIDQIESGHFNKFLGTSYLINKFVTCFPILSRIAKVKVYEHVVPTGDTLSTIASELYGNTAYTKLIAFINQLDDTNTDEVAPTSRTPH